MLSAAFLQSQLEKPTEHLKALSRVFGIWEVLINVNMIGIKKKSEKEEAARWN